MCLYLTKSSELKTEKLKARKGPIKAYKVLERYGKDLCSPFFHAKWKPGRIHISSRKHLKHPAKVTRMEASDERVFRGLHFYTARSDARIAPYGEVWMVEIKPKDIVSAGISNGFNNIVAHKAKLIKKVS